MDGFAIFDDEHLNGVGNPLVGWALTKIAHGYSRLCSPKLLPLRQVERAYVLRGRGLSSGCFGLPWF